MVTTQSYSDNTITTTVSNITGGSRVYTKTYDGSGLLITSEDPGGTLTYSYSSAGKPKQIQTTTGSSSTTTTMDYDGYGRQTSLTDPDAGTTSYTYDALGRIKTQEDNKGTIYTITYDALGRMITKACSDGSIINYTFDNQPNGIGMPGSVSGTGYSNINRSFAFDSFGRMQSTTETIDAINYTTSYTYDALSRVTNVTYPSGFQIGKVYNVNGYLQKIVKAGDNSLIWQCNSMNVYNEITAASAGNSTTTTNQYSSLGVLQSTKLAPNANPTQYLLNYGYNFDATTGNLVSRSNTLRGLTENFTYDGDNIKLDRLTNTSLNSVSTLTTAFASNGNISTKSDAGTYQYVSNKPHAISEITNYTTNISDVLQDITYTPFNKVLTITEGANRAEFTYGTDFERKKMVTKQSGTTIETKYYQANYEKVITPGKTRELHYISGSNGLCAIYTKNNGVDSMYYVNTDHLGSIIAISKQAGTIAEERSYDAWGRLRNPINWTYTSVPVMGITARGYTTHEHLTAFRLINMNGRCYDPVLGRMLSPDNFVQLPNATQNYNRFSYALNNPLKYTDPSGNLFKGTLFTAGFDFVAKAFFQGGLDPTSKKARQKAWVAFDPTSKGTKTNNAFRIDIGMFKADPDKGFFGKAWQITSRFTWERRQTKIGRAYSHFENIFGNVESVEYFHGATIVENKNENLFFNRGGPGVTIGSYINVGNNPDKALIQHEYGHYLQSRVSGPLYISKYGIPSLLTGTPIGFQGDHDDFWAEQDADDRSSAFFSGTYKARNFKDTNPQWYEYVLGRGLIVVIINRINPAP